ncbi:hypothetical protein ASPZODRAFT_127963 [Penicilliopsis zonata CBS 506.65]|uniref:Uncharacterized protein n=1 Tax=Penicilliopsis zonata CBS 506.65 TaxID=1073090 RepID=A0A1L9SXC4_9EURO|nr:hypothetical protein ASPZODRAFT_127963 [Penicilliopsis zonata CBS 506.65]OJJ51834.1 hypothetical protein ASPZODRAFT_127963 [Penicilliopsis zonata CBS 506.65]
MASEALVNLAYVRQMIKSNYKSQASDLFMNEIQSSILLRFSWGELLATAPTALTLLSSLCIAASSPMAGELSLAEGMPKNGFQYLQNRGRSSTLRTALLDVCNGGYKAFAASDNAKRQGEIVKRQVDEAEKRLGDALENIPGPWTQAARGLVTGFTEGLPCLIAAPLRAILQGGAAPTDSAPSSAALGIRDLVALFYESLGGRLGGRLTWPSSRATAPRTWSRRSPAIKRAWVPPIQPADTQCLISSSRPPTQSRQNWPKGAVSRQIQSPTGKQPSRQEIQVCEKLCQRAAGGDRHTAGQQQILIQCSEETARNTAQMVGTKHQDMYEKLQAQARQANTSRQMVEEFMQGHGIVFNEDSRQAIRGGADGGSISK